MSTLEFATNAEPLLHYWAFDWHDELSSILNSVRLRLGKPAWQILESVYRQDPAEFFRLLPPNLHRDVETTTRDHLLSYLWEILGRNTGLFPFCYSVNQTPSGPIVTAVNYRDPRDVLDIFASSPLARPDEILDESVYRRRLSLREAQIAGFTSARNLMLTAPPGSLIFWTSPPGKKEDGYPGFSVIFFAQKQPDGKTIHGFSLTTQMRLLNHIDLLNHYLLPEERLPDTATLHEILNKAVLLPASPHPRDVSEVTSILEQILSDDQETPVSINFSPFDLNSLHLEHCEFVENSISRLFAGKSPDQLQSFLRSFNRQNKNEVCSSLGGSSSACGEIDFREDPRALPGQKHENQKPFHCPACGIITDPCSGYCHNCNATPENWRKVREHLLKPKPDPAISSSSSNFNPLPSISAEKSQISNLKSQFSNNHKSSPLGKAGLISNPELSQYILAIIGFRAIKIPIHIAARFDAEMLVDP